MREFFRMLIVTSFENLRRKQKQPLMFLRRGLAKYPSYEQPATLKRTTWFYTYMKMLSKTYFSVEKKSVIFIETKHTKLYFVFSIGINMLIYRNKSEMI